MENEIRQHREPLAFVVSAIYIVIQGTGEPVNIDWLQKAAVVVVVWFVCFVFALSEVHHLVWPTERRIAAIQAGQYPVDVAPPLPPAAWITTFATPTGIAGALVFTYRNRTKRSRQQRVSDRRQSI